MEERRIVTVLFCDVAGSTALASRVDAEDWAEIISGAFPLLIDPVERYGGTVARLMGDAILAFFGAPTSRADDPQRAILAALEILDGINTYREQVRADYGLDFNVRVGINTGVVITGEFGTAAASEYTAMGDAVNVAARMEQTAAPGTIQIADETYQLVADDFEFEPLGPIQVKGKDVAVEAYRVLRRAAEPVHRRDLREFATPIVGRERELGLLRYMLADLEAGRGGAVALIGDAGLGKSALVDELRRTWFSSPGRHPESWIEDHLISFEASAPYGLLRRRLGQALQMEFGQVTPRVQARLNSLLASYDAGERDSAQRTVGRLFGGDQESISARPSGATTSAEDFRHELAMVTKQIITAWIEEVGSGVYVVDDLHAADPASVELLESILPDLIRLPLLVVFAFRPERESPAWGLHERLMPQLGVSYMTISLAPLDRQTFDTLLETLLPGAQFPQEFKRVLLERIEGNPLFAKEFVRSLVERDVIREGPSGNGTCWQLVPGSDLAAIAIPTTLRALVQERMDRLDAGARQTLYTAAVIGRTFDLNELAEVAADRDPLPDHLSALERAALIRRDLRADRGSHEFQHALIWEAVYRSILRRNRRRLHRDVAEALERLYSDRIEIHAGRLGQHFAAAGDERALPYAITAGNQAFSLHASAEAVEHYSRAVETAERLGHSVPFQVLRRRGASYLTLGEHERARQDFERALDIAQSDEDLEAEWQALTDIADLWEGIDYARSGEWRQRAQQSAERIGDPLLITDALARLGNWYTNFERSDEARAALTQALVLSREHGFAHNEAQILDWLGMLESLAGDAIKGYAHFRDAAAIFEELGDLPRLASANAGLSLTYGNMHLDTIMIVPDRKWEEGVTHAEQSFEIAQSIGWRAGQAFALIHVASISAWRGHYRRGFDSIREALDHAAAIQHMEWLALGQSILGAMLLDVLAFDAAIKRLEQAYSHARETGSDYVIFSNAGYLASAYVAAGQFDRASELIASTDTGEPAWPVGRRRVRFAKAELELATGNSSQALRTIDDLYETAANLTFPGDIPRLALLRGEALLGLGNVDEALQPLDDALHGAETRELLPLLWRIHSARGRALRISGRLDDAAAAQNQAVSIVQRLTEELADDEVRQGFQSTSGAIIMAAFGGPDHSQPAQPQSRR